MLNQKTENFICKNDITQLNKNPTESFQKQIQQTMQKCNILIERKQQKFLSQIKPSAPTLNALIKTHKQNEPIRPVINNLQAPSHKLAKYINKKLNQLIQLPYTYATKNSSEAAHDLRNISINNQLKIISLDLKDLYVNLPIKKTYWLLPNSG